MAWIEREKLPALAIISRPYNGSDPVLNLGVPKKLREMGVLPVPMDFLPVEPNNGWEAGNIADQYPNMYWSYGQKILAAARFIERHPSLSAVYITNFRCGPDSFISHLVKDVIVSKPCLQIEVDEHSSDTGVITRLEAFLDSLKNAREKMHRRQNTEHPTRSTGMKDRTVYLPRMCDHAEALAAALRAYAVRAEVLPPSDDKTFEFGRKYTSGRECHPFIVTTGDFLRKINEPGFDPDKSAFFMPTASGPCRFGHYNQTQKMVFKQVGYGEIPVLSPDVRDAYGGSMGLGLGFRRLAWQGIVATDLLNELTAKTRPYEKEKGATDKLHARYLALISRSLERKKGEIFRLAKEMKKDFASIPLTDIDHKPRIGIVGEIFLRYNPVCNGDIVRKVEKLGGMTHTAPISEWFYYTNLGYIYESWMRRLPHHFMQALVSDLVQKWDEKKLGHRQPSALKLIGRAAPHLHYTFKGEAVLTVGKAIDLIKKGSSGIINVMPFTCMPGTVVSAVAGRIREDFPGIPWLDVPVDGTEGVNLETRLEAFMHQAACYNDSIPRGRK
jgi:predicted nucleotide-binding protein (sugar kinase/HSP70/actin superfamily)